MDFLRSHASVGLPLLPLPPNVHFNATAALSILITSQIHLHLTFDSVTITVFTATKCV